MTVVPVNVSEDMRRDDATSALVSTQSTSPLAAIVDGMRIAIARYRYRRTIESLSRFRPHLLRDMGFEPDAVYDAANGDWRGIDARGRRG